MVKIIAELSINHLGSRKIALATVRECVKMGVDYIKLKKKKVSDYYNTEEKYRGYNFKLYRESLELNHYDFIKIDKFCKRYNIKWFSTIHDEYGFNFMNKFDIPFYKVASMDARDKEFISWFTAVNKEKKPMIVSTGGMDLNEIIKMSEYIRKKEVPLIINHCVSIYPTPIEQTNIGFISKLQNHLHPDIKIGYSGHEEGWVPTLNAVSLGVEFVERHITLTRDWKIHHINASLTIDEFSKMIKDIRNTEKLMATHAKSFEDAELEFLEKRKYK
jgi:N-acetylneuraminate synthase